MAVKFNLPPTAYTPAGLTMLHPDQVANARREYQRLRRVAEKRLARFENSEFSDSEVYRRNKNKFTPLSRLSNDRDLGAMLYEVRRFLDARQSSVTGMRAIVKEQIATLHENGYTFVNKSNLKAFGEFMEAARIAAGGLLRGSDRVAEMFDAAERKNIDPMELFKNFDYWRANLDKLNDLPTIEGEGVNARTYQRKISAKKAAETRRKRAKRGDAE